MMPSFAEGEIAAERHIRHLWQPMEAVKIASPPHHPKPAGVRRLATRCVNAGTFLATKRRNIRPGRRCAHSGRSQRGRIVAPTWQWQTISCNCQVA